jgi:hypothetical protein
LDFSRRCCKCSISVFRERRRVNVSLYLDIHSDTVLSTWMTHVFYTCVWQGRTFDRDDTCVWQGRHVRLTGTSVWLCETSRVFSRYTSDLLL